LQVIFIRRHRFTYHQFIGRVGALYKVPTLFCSWKCTFRNSFIINYLWRESV